MDRRLKVEESPTVPTDYGEKHRSTEVEELIQTAEALCEKFLQKCRDGRARSVETKHDMQLFMCKLRNYRDKH